MFLQHIFSLLLQQKICEQTQISNHLFTYFGRIRILDATVFQVPNALDNVYPGSGGCAQTAGIKIQLEYDLHSGEFLNFQVGPGKNNDKTFGTECLDTLRPGDLCIRDLGPNGSTRYILCVSFKIKYECIYEKSRSRIL